MTTFAQAISRFSTSAYPEIRVLKTLGLFCSALLFVLILRATYGLDLSPGFF
jgi:hypothetical protein